MITKINPNETSFCPSKHQELMNKSEDYRSGYEYAIDCIRRMPPISVENLEKMAFIFLDFNQPNAAGMAYCYWEMAKRRVAA